MNKLTPAIGDDLRRDLAALLDNNAPIRVAAALAEFLANCNQPAIYKANYEAMAKALDIELDRVPVL